MTVKAITPQVPALGGGLQFYRDLDFYDVGQDERATGDPYDFEWPDKPLRLNSRQALQRTAGAEASSASLIHGPGDREGGRNARTPGPKSSAREGSCAGTPSTRVGGDPLGEHPHQPGSGTSSPLPGQGAPTAEVRPTGGHRSAP